MGVSFLARYTCTLRIPFQARSSLGKDDYFGKPTAHISFRQFPREETSGSNALGEMALGRFPGGDMTQTKNETWSFSDVTSQKVSIKSFCKSRFPHKSVDIFFTLVTIKDKLTDLCGN